MDIDSDDDEYEEESAYVIFDLGTEISMDAVNRIVRANGGIAITGIETPKPVMQLGSQFFQGTLDEYVGDPLLFELDEKKSETLGLLPMLTSMRAEDDAARQPRLTTTYSRTVNKIIKFEKVELINKKLSEANEAKSGIKQSTEDEGDEDDELTDSLIADIP
ncbi:hypothetical protein EC973_001779 [Apophysomyces ossiformis]|uniref:Transcription factor TFIIIC triple barrel domain-containing protein n=1 Tax=Apophysomyces ossiformis TaxID=679940 RepID=A0A8H7ENB1_9FUNG|nr:hypothetical protein EC973_001779 [Apophysomyces ossiformis]